MTDPTVDRDRYRALPTLIPATALVTLQPTDAFPPVPLGPEGGGDGDGD